jgi:hypothetical protein
MFVAGSELPKRATKTNGTNASGLLVGAGLGPLGLAGGVRFRRASRPLYRRHCAEREIPSE